MDFVRDAGWPIYPVMLLGVITLLSAIGYARGPRRETLGLIVGFGLATLLMGTLGTALGIDASARGVEGVPPEQRWIFVIGLRESLNNLSVSLLFVLAATLTTTLGAYRRAPAPSGGVVPATP